MPSLISRGLRHQIRFVTGMVSRFEVEASRTLQDSLGQLSSRMLAGVVEYTDTGGPLGLPACWASPLEKEIKGTVLYLHGGGYVAGSLDYSKLFGGVLAARCGKRVLCIGYSLAPENPYPAALDDALASYRYLLGNGCDPSHMAIAGESAGGGLALCLIHRIRQEGLPLPAALVCVSPWTDLTLSGASMEYNKKHDISLRRRQLEHYVECYAPEDLTLPTVSPAWGSFAGFPPALVIAGGDEIILDDSRAVLRGYLRDGEKCRLIIAKGMWHAYPLYPTLESAKALELIDEFLEEELWMK